MGGGGFTMGERTPALDRLVLELTGHPEPRICFLPTASGDPREQIVRFQERFGAWPCRPSVLSLFHLPRDRIDPVAHLLEQDAIYVGGGSMRNLLAVWREHRLIEAMRSAWERGVVLAGLSAGAMCWLQGGISLSGGRPEVVKGLGLVRGSLSVHLGSEPDRLPAFEAAVGRGELPAGHAADDGAALLFEGQDLVECVASQPAARVLRVEADGEGGASRREVKVRLLTARGAVVGRTPAPEEDLALSELRALRRARRG